MKILYELVITEETGFTDKDFPDSFVILREGKTPLVWKPVALSMQDIYFRLQETEDILREVRKDEPILDNPESTSLVFINIDQYFKRYSQ